LLKGVLQGLDVGPEKNLPDCHEDLVLAVLPGFVRLPEQPTFDRYGDVEEQMERGTKTPIDGIVKGAILKL
jgi:hypothetical protein